MSTNLTQKLLTAANENQQKQFTEAILFVFAARHSECRAVMLTVTELERRWTEMKMSLLNKLTRSPPIGWARQNAMPLSLKISACILCHLLVIMRQTVAELFHSLPA